MSKVVQLSKNVADTALVVKKALVAFAGVIAAIQVADGVPADYKEVARNAGLALAAFGITYAVKNRKAV